MGFNQEILPQVILGELYSKSLVILEADKAVSVPVIHPTASPDLQLPVSSQPATLAPIKFLGNNSRKVVLVVSYAQETFLPDVQLQFLTKILGACKLNLGDIALINQGNVSTDFETIKKELAPDKILLFGIDPSAIKLPIQFPDFKAQLFNGCVFVKSPACELLNREDEEARSRKMQLWNALKQLFQL